MKSRAENGGAGKGATLLAMGPALADLGVSVLIGASRTGNGAQGCSSYSSTDALDFLCTQRTSALANQNSFMVIHTFLLSSL
jgi:hypothetical protein